MTVTCTFKKEKKEEADGENSACIVLHTELTHSFIMFGWIWNSKK